MPAPQDPQRPFERDAFFDDPGIVGARWWNRSFDAEIEATRRQALKVMTAIGAVALLGVGGAAVAIAAQPDGKLTRAIEVQREIGWNAGAYDQSLTFANPITALDQPALLRLAETMKPRRYAPFWVGTQLEVITATPRRTLAGATVWPMTAVIQNLQPGPLQPAFLAGKTLASLFAGENLGCLVVVDASGPRSVAFAAGASSTFEPVLLLDNWPHPAGIVASHETLGALVTHERDFAAGAAVRSSAAPPPLFVLDRGRAVPLTDPEAHFDNRYFAALPAASTMKQWGFSRALLVVSDVAGLPEAGDVAAAFADYAAAGMDVQVIGLDRFSPDGGYPGGAGAFFLHHPWRGAATPTPGGVPPKTAPYGGWRPGASPSPLTPKGAPPGFGQVIAYVDDGGVIVGIDSYGGTRDRASGGWGG